MDATNRLPEQRRDRDDLDLWGERDRLGFDRIRDQQPFDGAAIEAFHRSCAEHAMRHCGVNGLRAALDQLVGSIGKGAGRDRKIVDDESGFPRNLSDDLEDLGALVMRLALLVADGDGGTEKRGILARLLRESDVRLNDDEVGQMLVDDLVT